MLLLPESEWYLARIYLQQEDYQKAFECLDESYRIMLALGRLDGICFVGRDLGALLCRAGEKDQGLAVLEKSRTGFIQLGRQDLAGQVAEIMRHFRG